MTVAALQYLTGFGSEHETEALDGALPKGQFSPQRCPYGLYAEQFSTTAFTAPRAHNRRSWTYRLRPSVVMGGFTPWSQSNWLTAPLQGGHPSPEPMRWSPPPAPEQPLTFIEGVTTVAVNGDARSQCGLAIHLYQANRGMGDSAFYNADGELLLLPEQGELSLFTEFGRLQVAPGEIAVIPRGVKFKVDPVNGPLRGYLAENYGAPLTLPERGPVGANGFANERDFLYPVAWFEDRKAPHQLFCKFAGGFHSAPLSHSPFDVVAWTGNSAPYKYELSRFNVMGSVSFDHPDPSIFTVLTSPSDTAGWANLDFVIFPPRWMVAEHTFRPPWFHRNVMSEFMGLIKGQYDAKADGFLPGGMSLHNCMTPHGPDAAVHAQGSTTDLKPERYRDTLAFMLESRYLLEPTPHALNSTLRQQDYAQCWQGLESQFNGHR
ncbi:homogentisate 1,2-dioxygenase [Ferrimonas gelatinilytica]|uniref:Homogentisate 1,2-dioxygenase n=1 Tax=Ferrimonas gelatinilytica TaxID=1255257 RepID=A0ABP9RSB3_9GAMM